MRIIPHITRADSTYGIFPVYTKTIKKIPPPAANVNLFHVTGFTEKEVAVGKIKIPLSRRNRKKFESTFMEFDIKYR